MIQDARSDFKLSKVFPDLANRWKKARENMLAATGRQIRATSGYRSFTEQWELWGKGRLKEKSGVWVICDEKLVVTHARPGSSLHQFGLAIDSCFDGLDPYLEKLPRAECNATWDILGKMFTNEGMTWGGKWPGAKMDRPHCQMMYGLSIHTIQIAYENHGINSVWNMCKNAMLCGNESVL